MESGIDKITIDGTVVSNTEGIFKECAGILWKPNMRDCGINESQDAFVEQFSVRDSGITIGDVLQADDQITRYITGHEKVHVIWGEFRCIIASQSKRAINFFES